MSDGSILKYFIEIREPGCVPEKKGPFPPDYTKAIEFVREVFGCRPDGTKVSLIGLTWDHDLWINDGGVELRINDDSKRSQHRRKPA